MGQVRHDPTTLTDTADQNVDLPPRQSQSLSRIICGLMLYRVALSQWPDDVRPVPGLLPSFVRQGSNALLAISAVSPATPKPRLVHTIVEHT